jgi:prevent-host-death family protein
MKIASVAEIKSKFSEYINASKKGAVVITKNGKATAVLLSVTSDEQLEQILISQSPMLKKLLDKSERQIAAGRKITHGDFWEEIEKRDD